MTTRKATATPKVESKSIETESEVVSIDVVSTRDGVPKTTAAETEASKRSGVLLILIGITRGTPK
jgi:predicted solute-binding protein